MMDCRKQRDGGRKARKAVSFVGLTPVTPVATAAQAAAEKYDVAIGFVWALDIFRRGLSAGVHIAARDQRWLADGPW
jgi:hypothetical protein